MPTEAQEIENPWAVCYWLTNLSIGKVIEDFGKSCYIQYSENQRSPLEVLNSEWIKRRFDISIKAIAYFKFKKYMGYTKEEAINFFLTKFPSERKNIESLLHSQS